MRIFSVLLALLLTGCATPVVTETCVKPQQYQQLKQTEPPKIRNRLHGKADEDIRIVAGSALELRAWGETMLGIIGQCSQ